MTCWLATGMGRCFRAPAQCGAGISIYHKYLLDISPGLYSLNETWVQNKQPVFSKTKFEKFEKLIF
jgi:hypothetical protein